MLLSSFHIPPARPIDSPKLQSRSARPPLLLRFRTSHLQNLRYLKTLGIINTSSSSNNKNYGNKFSSPETLDRILSIVNYLKSKGFSDSDFHRLSFLCPRFFSSDLDPTDIAPVFDFLDVDLAASPHESCSLILRCPAILLADVEYCLRPTLLYLIELGLRNLNSPTTLNAHLLNTRTEKLVAKVRFLESLGFSYEESARVCARLPAIFGYSIENNLTPKVRYLLKGMNRSIDELKTFPQYLAFSLEKRIAPRHLHLKERNVKIPLPRMLLWSDQRFYAKWK